MKAICQKQTTTLRLIIKYIIDSKGAHDLADSIQYNLDDDTQELLEQIFNWAQELIDLQKGEDVHEDMMTILLEAADRFNIQRNTIYIEETEQDDGTVNLKIKVEPDEPQPQKPKLTVVSSNDSPEDKITMLENWKKSDDDPTH